MQFGSPPWNDAAGTRIAVAIVNTSPMTLRRFDMAVPRIARREPRLWATTRELELEALDYETRVITENLRRRIGLAMPILAQQRHVRLTQASWMARKRRVRTIARGMGIGEEQVGFFALPAWWQEFSSMSRLACRARIHTGQAKAPCDTHWAIGSYRDPLGCGSTTTQGQPALLHEICYLNLSSRVKPFLSIKKAGEARSVRRTHAVPQGSFFSFL